MTRDEFMTKARAEIDQILAGQKNRMMNLVEQAWAEGKRNAEVGAVTDIVKRALEKARPTYPVYPTAPTYPDPTTPWFSPIVTCDTVVGTKPPEAHFGEDGGKSALD